MILHNTSIVIFVPTAPWNYDDDDDDDDDDVVTLVRF